MKVLFFARARDLAGCAEVELDLPAGTTLGQLRRLLAERYPALVGLLDRSALALDGEQAADDCPVRAASEVALLPPVSGGSAPFAGGALPAVGRTRCNKMNAPRVVQVAAGKPAG